MRLGARWTLTLTVFALALTDPAVAADSERPEPIGNWVLICPTSSSGCLMRLSQRFFDKAGVTGDLEVQAQGSTLVPVLTVRGLPNEMLLAAAMAGKPEASVQFAGSAAEPLNCAASTDGYLCAPDEAAGRRLATALVNAHRVTLRASLAIQGMKPLPPQERSLDLIGTADALARVRKLGPSAVPRTLPAMSPASQAGLMEMADKALKAAGYPDGVARLQELLAKYMKK